MDRLPISVPIEHQITEAPFEAIFSGRSGFVVMPYVGQDKGDKVILEEVDHQGEFTGRILGTEITYITSRDNHCALSPEALNAEACIASIAILNSVNLDTVVIQESL